MKKNRITYCVSVLTGVLALAACTPAEFVVSTEAAKPDVKGEIITTEIAGGIEGGSVITGEYALLADNPNIKFGRDITVIPEGVIINVYGAADVTTGNLIIGGTLNITAGAKLTATNDTNIITIGLPGGLEWEQPPTPEPDPPPDPLPPDWVPPPPPSTPDPYIVGSPRITGTLNVEEGGTLVANSATGATAIKMAAYNLKNLYPITNPPTTPPPPFTISIADFVRATGNYISGSGAIGGQAENVIAGAANSVSLNIENGAAIALTYNPTNVQVSALMKKTNFNVLLSTSVGSLTGGALPSIQVVSGNCLIADSLTTIGTNALIIDAGGIVEFLGNASLATAGNITVNGLLKTTSSAFKPGGKIVVGEGGVIEVGTAGAFTIPATKSISTEGLVTFAPDAGTIAINGQIETRNGGKFIVNSGAALKQILAPNVFNLGLAVIELGSSIEMVTAAETTIKDKQILVIPDGITLTAAGDDTSNAATKLSVVGSGILTNYGTIDIKGGSLGGAILSAAGNKNFAGTGLIFLEGGTAAGADASIEVLASKLTAGRLIDDVQSKYLGRIRIGGAFPSGNVYSTPNTVINTSATKASSPGTVSP